MEKICIVYHPESNCWAIHSPITCPDLTPFPKYFYKEYEVQKESCPLVYDNLIDLMCNLNRKKITPSKEKNIFPELTDLLK
ncbi:MAG: hypothetical protein AABY22_32110 [Nanoarchaeota archaeon]